MNSPHRFRSLFTSRSLPTLLLGFVLTGCVYSTVPVKDDAIGFVHSVFDPSTEDPTGNIFLQPDGRFVYVAKDRAKPNGLVAGDLAAFSDDETEERHIFVVVSDESWGLRLQKLTPGTIRNQFAGSLFPLKTMNDDVSSRWRFCSGSPKQIEACAAKTPQRLFHVYDSDALVEAGNVWARRAALIQDTKTVAGTLPKNGIAVPDFTSHFLAKPRIGSNCAPGSLPTGAMDEVVQTPAPPTEFGLREAFAYEHRIDVMVVCDNDDATVWVPSLFRPVVPTTLDALVGPTILGILGSPIDRSDKADARAVIRAAGYAATGDWVRAGFWTEQLLTNSSSKADDLFMTNAASMAIVSGRADLGLAMLQRAYRRHWNPDTDPRYVLQRAIASNAVGGQKDALVALGGLLELIEKSKDEKLRDWIVFHKLKRELYDPATGAQTIVGSTGIAQPWIDAFDLLRFGTGLSEKQPVVALLQLSDAMAGKDLYTQCDGCAVDGYGRALSTSTSPENLDQTPRFPFRPGFTIEQWELLSFRSKLSAFRLLQPDDLENALLTLVGTTDDWCVAPAPTLRDSDNTIPEHRALTWLVEEKIPAFCNGDRTLDAELTYLDDDAEALSGVAFATAKRTTFNNPKISEASTKEMLRFAQTGARGQDCVDLGVAYAARLIEALRIDEATEVLTDVGKCGDGMMRQVSLLSAISTFELTRKISLDFDKATIENVESVLRIRPTADPALACIGAYDERYAVVASLNEPARKIAVRIELDKVADDVLEIAYASDDLREANTALIDAEKSILTAPTEYVRNVNSARAYFVRTSNLPGLRRVDFILSQTTEKKGKDRALSKSFIRDVKSAAPSTPLRALAWALLKNDRPAVVAGAKKLKPKTLCKPPADKIPYGKITDFNAPVAPDRK